MLILHVLERFESRKFEIFRGVTFAGHEGAQDTRAPQAPECSGKAPECPANAAPPNFEGLPAFPLRRAEKRDLRTQKDAHGD